MKVNNKHVNVDSTEWLYITIELEPKSGYNEHYVIYSNGYASYSSFGESSEIFSEMINEIIGILEDAINKIKERYVEKHEMNKIVRFCPICKGELELRFDKYVGAYLKCTRCKREFNIMIRSEGENNE